MKLENNTYTVQKIDLKQLVRQYDDPLYVYDAAVMKRQFNRLINAFGSVKNLQLNYACKALSNLSVLKYFKSLGAGLDTVSIEEVKLGLKAGFSPHEIIFTPNGVSLQELKQAAHLGVKINIDNLSILEQFGHDLPDYPVCIRINPHIMAGGNTKISVGHIDSKFGISYYQLPHVKRIISNTGMNVEGIHMHTGSDILDIDVFLNGAEILFNVAQSFKRLKYIDFGSGFKVPYKENDVETNIEELGEKLGERFNIFCQTYGSELTLIFEPGKFLVSQAGYFLTRTNVVKQTTSTVFAGVNSGFNHFIRPMLYDSYHEIINLSNPNGRNRFYTVVGYICETDTFAVNRKIKEIKEGDILCFKNAGAYCYTMASNYNARLLPAEVLIIEGKAHLIRKRQSFEELLNNQIEIDFSPA